MTALSSIKPETVERVRVRLASSAALPTPSTVAVALRAEGSVLGDAALLDAAIEIYRDLVGAGPLEPLLHEEAVTDVLVNAPDEVWVERAGQLVRTEVTFPDEGAVRRLAQRLAALAGRRLDDARPFVDARLPDGTRLHAVLPPVASRGTILSLRVPRRSGFDLEGLVATGMFSHDAVRLLRAILAARLAFLVTGGTGTGKTTLLNALLGALPAAERVVLVEDCVELRPSHANTLVVESRPPNQDGAGAVTLRDLVRQSLRMRPDRIVVGEVRGPEVVDLLNALNTGHEGGCGTLHANRAEDVPARIEALALPAGLPREAAHSQLAAGIDCVIHLARSRDGSRRLTTVSVLCRDSSGLVRLVPAIVAADSGEMRPGVGESRLRELLDTQAVGSKPDALVGWHG